MSEFDGEEESAGTELAVVDPPSYEDFRESPTALAVTIRAEIDSQILTARQYPRDVSRFVRKAKAMVEIDPLLAEKCTYVLPARKGGDNKAIKGPSVRLAEIVALCWGHLLIGGRITGDDGKFITAQGGAHDLESNVKYVIEVRAGVTYSPDARWNPGGRFSDDMVKTTCNRAIALATRNATFKVVPRAFVSLIESHASAVAKRSVKSVPERARSAVKFFAERGVKDEKVFASIGVTSIDEMTVDQLMILRGYANSVEEGHATLEEIFGVQPVAVPAQLPGEGKTASVARRLSGKDTAKVVPAPETKPDGKLFPEATEGKGAY